MTRTRTSTRTVAAALAVLATLGVTSAAQGATVGYEGDTLVYRAASGEENRTGPYPFGPDPGKVVVPAGYNVPLTSIPEGCEDWRDNGGFVVCPMPPALKFVLDDGNDDYSSSTDMPAGVPVTVDGGDGNDSLTGWGANDTLSGGAGNDKLSGWTGDDVLDGGDGDDEISGYAGRDRLTGGAGNDMLHPDDFQAPATDVVDGGAGIDTIESDYSFGDPRPPLAFTLAGGADDGRPGENDDVTGVERLILSDAGRIVGTDGPDFIKIHQAGGSSELIGGGGDDELRASDGSDKLDGGAGNDVLDGGYGDDTITGGPGADRISSDQSTSECSSLWCKHPYGNDVVEARDGEADSIECGAGQDLVRADAVDTVAPTCETVDRAAAPVAPVATAKPRGAKAAKRVKALSSLKLKTALRRGLTLSVTGLKKGAKVKVLSGRKTVAKGTAKKAGRVKVTFTKAARRALARKRSVTLTVVAGNTRETLKLKR